MVDFKPARDIPDLSSKTIICTGGTDGLGKESVLQLAQHGSPTIFLAARNKAKAEAAIKDIQAVAPKAKIEFLQLDLSSFDSIKSAAKEFDAKSPKIDVLLNNAGIMATPAGLTKEGYEIQFGTNHLGVALFTELLMPKLEKTAKMPGADVRVVNLSSDAHRRFAKSGYGLAEKKGMDANTSTLQRYAQSKMANIQWTRELAKRHPELLCVSLHPGVVNTNLLSGIGGNLSFLVPVAKVIARYAFTTVEQGAWTQLWAATAPRDKVKTGAYYVPVGKPGTETAMAKNEKMAKELWDWTEEQLKGHK